MFLLPLRGLVCFMYFTGVFFRSSERWCIQSARLPISSLSLVFYAQKAHKNVDENVVKFRLGVTVISVVFNHHVNRET